MANEISRNDPCPCGSGKKYKQCCLNNPISKRRNVWKLVLVLVVAVAAGIAGWQLKDMETGIAAGIGTLLVVGMLATFINPPPSSGSGSPGAINFGG